MSTLQRRTLWRQGRNAWEAWSKGVLEKKRGLEEAGLWAVNWFGQGQNEETRAWLNEASVDFTSVEFGEQDADFSGFVFPGPASFDGARFGRANFVGARFAMSVSFASAQFRRELTFAGASFTGPARFDDIQAGHEADFEGALFEKESNGPLSPSVSFVRAAFRQKADFRAVKIAGAADFKRAQFAEVARFDEAELKGEGQFAAALFAGLVSFCKTRFAVRADFSESLFGGEARFGETRFDGPACFDVVRFGGEALFRDARFAAESEFAGAQFDADAIFESASFKGRANFPAAKFGRKSSFQKARFNVDGRFDDAHFAGNSLFSEAHFRGDARFAATHFAGTACFSRCVFGRDADFQSTTTDAAFAMAGARFVSAPAFHEACFRNPPRLDTVSINDPLRRFRWWSKREHKDPRPLLMRWMKVARDPDMASKYRKLRYLAMDAHDHQSERNFFAEELRCRRFWQEKAFGKGFGRFWLGWLYGGVSDFGRSMLRPLTAWAGSVVVFALFYLGRREGEVPVESVAHPAFPGWPPKPTGWDRALYWAGEFLSWSWQTARWTADGIASLFITNACVEGGSNPVGEAFYLSLKNALVISQWENDHVVRRVYGCLYGVDRDGGPITPLGASAASLGQMVVSGVLIFLFLLALRNLLKVK